MSAQPLRDAVKAQFHPFARSQGFEKMPRHGGHFTRFRRRAGEGFEVLEIQWDKSNRPWFVVNFGRCEDGEEKDCALPCRLQRSRGGALGHWFGLRKPWLEWLRTGQRSYAPDAVVAEAIAAFPEMLAWWASGAEGPHVHRPR